MHFIEDQLRGIAQPQTGVVIALMRQGAVKPTNEPSPISLEMGCVQVYYWVYHSRTTIIDKSRDEHWAKEKPTQRLRAWHLHQALNRARLNLGFTDLKDCNTLHIKMDSRRKQDPIHPPIHFHPIISARAPTSKLWPTSWLIGAIIHTYGSLIIHW